MRPTDGVDVEYLLKLLAELEERCDGEPHCHGCVFCGAMERGVHAETCPWPKVVALTPER